MITPGDVGGGLGTASSVCTISPADNEAIINNLIARIEKLEFDLSQVLGANLHANTLGDVSSQVGWVYGIEYMGIPGWTQTEYGTLIPPAGFTLSGSGMQLYNSCTGEFEDYQAVVMDSDGVLQWGATAAGNLCGTKVEQWNNAVAIAEPPLAYLSSGVNTSNGGMTINSNSMSSDMGGAQVTVPNAGYYLISAGGAASLPSGPTSSWSYFLIVSKNSSSNVGGQSGAAPGEVLHPIYLNWTGIVSAAAGDTFEYETQIPGVGAELVVNKYFSIVRISDI